MGNNSYIIEDFNYTADDIKELVLVEDNNSAEYLKKISYLLMIGTTLVSTNGTCATTVEKNNSSQEIEFVVENTLPLEDYQNNILSLENYNFCLNKSENNNLWIEKILSFKALQQSWDGFDAIPLEIKSASNAINFLNSLSEKNSFVNPSDIFPNPHGTISLIWENLYNERLSLEIGNNSLSYYTLFNNNNPEFFNNVELIDLNIEDIARKINSLF